MSDRRDDKDGSGKALCYLILIAIVVVIIVVVVLALTVFRIRDPQITVDSFSLRSYSLTFPNSNPTLSFMVDLVVAVKNRNHASFKYRSSTAYIYYHGVGVGEAPIPPGKVSATSTTRIPVEVTVYSSNFVNNPFIAGDVAAGTIPFTATTTLPGRVSVAGIVKRHATAVSNCDFDIFVQSQSLGNFNCNTKFNL